MMKYLKSKWKDIAQYIVFGLFIFLIFPVAWGGHLQITVVSGISMLPNLKDGDLTVSWKTNDYATGDVIVYHPDDITCARCNIIHRITKENDDKTYVTQGDNNPFVDMWQPGNSEIKGKVLTSVSPPPWLMIFREPALWVMFLGIMGLLYLVVWYFDTDSHGRTIKSDDEDGADQDDENDENQDWEDN